MKRINITYGGHHYTVGHRELTDLKAEIDMAILSGTPYWLTVNQGEGAFEKAEIMITAASSIAIIGVNPPPADEE